MTLNVLSFEVRPDRPRGMRNLTFFGAETIDTPSFVAVRVSSVELVVAVCDVGDINRLSAAPSTLFSV
jgi:hypothetical protein